MSVSDRSYSAPPARDQRMQYFLSHTIRTPLRLQVLMALRAAHPRRYSLDTLTAHLRPNPTELAQALFSLLSAGLVAQRFWEGEVWYGLAEPSAAQHMTHAAYQLWLEHGEALLTEGMQAATIAPSPVKEPSMTTLLAASTVARGGRQQ